MKKVFGMLLILGIFASASSFGHGPPGQDKAAKVSIEKISFQAVVANYDQPIVETNFQALPVRWEMIEGSTFAVTANRVSTYREYRGSPTLHAPWNVDRSRFRWCSQAA